jgi:hypothetical protein
MATWNSCCTFMHPAESQSGPKPFPTLSRNFARVSFQYICVLYHVCRQLATGIQIPNCWGVARTNGINVSCWASTWQGAIMQTHREHLNPSPEQGVEMLLISYSSQTKAWLLQRLDTSRFTSALEFISVSHMPSTRPLVQSFSTTQPTCYTFYLSTIFSMWQGVEAWLEDAHKTVKDYCTLGLLWNPLA